MDESIMICSICRHTLDFAEDSKGSRWQHTFQDKVNEDHLPIPIPPDKDWAIRCDFCNVDRATWRIPARDFKVPILTGHLSSGSWAACVECGMLVDTNQWSALVRRVVDKSEEHGSLMSEASITALRALYRALRENITGSMKPI